MRNVLLIWEELPERSKSFVLEVSDETFALLAKCHGKYVNSDNWPQEDWVSEFVGAIPDDKMIFDSQKPGDPIQVAGGPITVIHTGFVL